MNAQEAIEKIQNIYEHAVYNRLNHDYYFDDDEDIEALKIVLNLAKERADVSTRSD